MKQRECQPGVMVGLINIERSLAGLLNDTNSDFKYYGVCTGNIRQQPGTERNAKPHNEAEVRWLHNNHVEWRSLNRLKVIQLEKAG